MKGGQAETSYRQAEGSLIQVVPAGLAGSLGSVAGETQAEVLVLFEHMPRG